MVSTRTAPGRAAVGIPHDDLSTWLRIYADLHIDIGTGDGVFARRLAQQNPDRAVIGIDTCLDNLTKAARRPHVNLRFLAIDAMDTPEWLHGRANSITINFPFGSLFHVVTGEGRDRQDRLFALARPGARIEMRVNSSAAAEYGVSLDTLRAGLTRTVCRLAPRTAEITVAPHHDLRSFPSTWAKRLAYGRPSDVIIASALIGV